MAELIEGITAERVTQRLDDVHQRIMVAAARAGRNAAEVTLVAATKYVPVASMEELARAGVSVVGENRAQDLVAKVDEYGDRFAWEFIGHLQSRKVKLVAPRVRRLHAVSSDSVADQLARIGPGLASPVDVLIDVNIAADPAKSGLDVAAVPAFLDRLRSIDGVTVSGLMTMPPRADQPHESRPWFAALRRLAETHELKELSMGTTQDFEVAVEEGATLVRVGSTLFQ